NFVGNSWSLPSCHSFGLSTALREYNPTFTQMCAMATAAEAADAPLVPRNSTDIWSDQPALLALQQGSISSALQRKEQLRVKRRIAYYRWSDGQLQRLMSDGTYRLVPTPEQRDSIIQECHEKFGHFRVRRTQVMLLLQYWWKGLLADTVRVISQCQHCSREQAAFTARPREL